MVALGALLLAGPVTAQVPARTQATVDLSGFETTDHFSARTEGENLRLTWRISDEERGALVLNLKSGQPLIEAIGVGPAGGELRPILERVDPAVMLTVGHRDPDHPGGWVAFFDNPPRREYRTHILAIQKRDVRVTGEAHRTVVSVGDATAGPFRGRYQFTLYRGSPLVFAEAVVKTEEDHRAYIYDAGLNAPRRGWHSMAWVDPEGEFQRVEADLNRVAGPVQVQGRALAAEGDAGTVVVFPPPHQYFYPLDFATNFGFAWFGSSGSEWLRGYGFGVRQPPEGDKRWVPWINAPPGTEQRLGLFYLVSADDAGEALREVTRYTHGDRYKELPGHRTFTSHYHVEHALELTRKRATAGSADLIPDELRVPGFVRTFKQRGIDIVHLAEFHVGATPRLPAAERLPLLKTLHEEAARLSDDGLLVLPGEEPNVHLGGHWLSLFPRPVYWVLNRAPGEPFAEQVPGYGKVYRVGSAADVLRLMEEENGLMWTAHARIKGSRAFPDAYVDSTFFRSDHYLGAAWKAMPADLSLPRLGPRVLDLQDDLSNRGLRKHILGEVDIFRVEPEMETWGHMNVNYLRLDRVPRFEDGWQPVLDALRGGRFFVSTGEVLIPEFTVGGRKSGEELTRPAGGATELRARLEWTFPLEFAEVISGDGERVYRQRIELDDTDAFGSREIRVPVDLADRTWMRFEVWDVARNGAFTPPVWIE